MRVRLCAAIVSYTHLDVYKRQASTCGSLVSNLIGAGEQDCVRGTIKQHIRIGYIFVLPILVFFCLFPDLILRIYTDIPRCV